jgi:hypothetical protein
MSSFGPSQSWMHQAIASHRQIVVHYYLSTRDATGHSGTIEGQKAGNSKESPGLLRFDLYCFSVYEISCR